MARTAQEHKAKQTPKFSTRIQRRCWRCGRIRGYLRKYKMCRICFRELATQGHLPGFKRASW